VTDLDRVRLAKALGTMSAEWDVSFEQLVAELDNETDDSDLVRETVSFLAASPRGAWASWLNGVPTSDGSNRASEPR
jgi:hypothetical protein